MEWEHLARVGQRRAAFRPLPSEGKTLLAREYAKYKNRLYRFHGCGIIYVSKNKAARIAGPEALR
jgi:hypothetical protein